MQLRTRRTRGQTLVISLIVLFVLVALGFITIILVGRQVTSTGFAMGRNVANDLANAGIRYTYSQLRFSEDGADWRPQPHEPLAADVDPARPPGLGPNSDPENPAATNPDPDYFWLRRQVDPVANEPLDRGGPDGLGAYTRLNFEGGRALVRVLYAPSGAELFDQTGVIPRDRGQLRAYTMLQSVGRPGRFNEADPTAVREPELQRSRMITAVATIGIIEHAHYVTNKDERNQPVELGIPVDFGANFMGQPVKVMSQRGGDNVTRAGGGLMTLGGPMYINGDLRVYGNVLDSDGSSGLQVVLNPDLGDQISIAGDLLFAESSSPLRLMVVSNFVNQTAFIPAPSASINYSTGNGIIRDRSELPDGQGYPRSIPRKEPPLIDEEDPSTGQMRYRMATRDSGAIGPAGFNLGRLGYGRGVYINNNDDLNRDSQDGNYTQRYDWLNPNGHPDGFWRGPYYLPPAASVLLLPDGFIISRYTDNPRDTWRLYSGQDSGRHQLRFKLGFGSQPGERRIINEFTPGIGNFANPGPGDFDQGVPFNGVIFAEGNVRVRGVIPSSVQITIVTLGSGYVDGSVVKGDPRSALAVLCQDNVVVNTTMFVAGQLPGTVVEQDAANPNSPHRIRVNSLFDVLVQFPNNPLTGVSYLQTYSYNHPSSGGNPVLPSFFVAHAADFDRNTFINLLVNEDAAASNPTYLFVGNNQRNAASPFYPGVSPIPSYGLADPNYQVLPVMEKRSFSFWPVTGAAGNGVFTLFDWAAENVFRFKLDNVIAAPGRGDYLVSRVGVQPMDVRIEAALYAQEGSFFVIPGVWFNPNPNDRREVFTSAAERFAAFQADEHYPFYGEPMDIRVNILGSVSENFPPAMSDQSAWLRNWGWIPAEYGASGEYIPDQHFPLQPGTNLPAYTNSYVPNLFINYDPALVSGRAGATFATTGTFDPSVPPIRTDRFGRALPPMPKLPVSTRLMYFGEVNP